MTPPSVVRAAILEAARSIAEEIEQRAQDFDRRGKIEFAAVCRAIIRDLMTWQARHEEP